jgi:hypothetical protein
MGFDQDQALETYKSMITIGTEALKALQLINGGAIVALLAYLGQVPERAHLAPLAAKPLALFLGGLVAATLAFLGTYLTQFTLLNEFFKGGVFRGPKHMFWLLVTMGVALASLALFAWGSFATVTALSRP